MKQSKVVINSGYARICSHCEYYDEHRLNHSYGICVIDPYTNQEIAMRGNDTCERWTIRTEED